MFQLQTVFSKVLAYLGVAALVALSYGAVYLWGSSNGKAIIQQAWNFEKAQYALATEKQEGVFAAKRANYLAQISTLERKVDEDAKKHTQALTAVAADYSARMRSHEARMSAYQRAAAGDEAKRKALADHAGELDRSLTEGRQLVGELRATLELRERQIQRLSEERENEHALH